jgi:hypothetical protein
MRTVKALKDQVSRRSPIIAKAAINNPTAATAQGGVF